MRINLTHFPVDVLGAPTAGLGREGDGGRTDRVRQHRHSRATGHARRSALTTQRAEPVYDDTLSVLVFCCVLPGEFLRFVDMSTLRLVDTRRHTRRYAQVSEYNCFFLSLSRMILSDL